ncbi:hypothetical protein J27TS7_23250 [Paenibacillus dendritiformis]|uniref:hypothetical protein n=1 Tax=Paenibacillus dendritiformis TaxID=130049 RepID=UPI001B125837|nr:hypothetical protein [Paenibacillus dendritiformis]GIO72811.1 hypothetical protein J27TS7_23250 [Paenibacillus dendritiformis]
MIHEKQLFLQKFIHQPKQIGSIIPSSMLLARTMTDAVPWDQVRSAAELGAGTGAITDRIQQVAAPSAKVFLFERDQILGQIEASLAPGGWFIAFQYSLQMKKQLSSRCCWIGSGNSAMPPCSSPYGSASSGCRFPTK